LTQESISQDTLSVLAGCHSLVSNQGKLLGDPIEKALFEAYNWKYSTTGFEFSFSRFFYP